MTVIGGVEASRYAQNQRESTSKIYCTNRLSAQVGQTGANVDILSVDILSHKHPES
jgi:hypothetical protein